MFHVEFTHAPEKDFPVGVLDVFHDETVVYSRCISHHIQERDNIWTSRNVSQNLDLLMCVNVACGSE